MNLACPHCQQILTVPEQNAGQQMNCPLCSNAFQVPVLPSAANEPPVLGDIPAEIPLAPLPPSPQPTPAPASPGEEESMYRVVPEPPKPPPPPPPPRREPSVAKAPEEPLRQPRPVPLPPSPPSTGYAKRHVFQVRPSALPWITAISLGLLFISWFFSWVGSYPGGYRVYTQNTFEILGGGLSTDPVGDKVLRMDDQLRQNISVDLLLLLYFPAVLVALALAVAALVFRGDRSRLLPALQQIWPWRTMIIAATATFAFLILLLQLWIGFGLENGFAKVVNAKLEPKRAAATTPEEVQKFEIERGSELGRFVIERTWFFRLAILCHLVAIAAVAIDIWLARRGQRPLPQLQVEW